MIRPRPTLITGGEALLALSCPRCGGVVSTPPERECDFQNYHVSRFKCERGDKFNLYIGASKTFTIPRPSLPASVSAARHRTPLTRSTAKTAETSSSLPQIRGAPAARNQKGATAHRP